MLTPQEQSMMDYLQGIYPRGLRSKDDDANSLVYKYDLTRVNSILEYMATRDEGVNNIFVSTSDEAWVTEWENFLTIPVDTWMSLPARKARLLVRLAWNPATIQNLRTVIETFIGTGVYELTELWKLSPFDRDDTWTYMVDLYNPQPNRFITEMITVLTSVHPAHCLLIMAYTRPILDNIGIEDNLDWALHDPFIRGEEWVPLPSDALWGSNLAPLVGGYWS